MDTNISILGSGWLGLPLAGSLQEQGFDVRVSASSGEKAEQLSQLGHKAHHVNIDGPMDSVFFDAKLLIVCITCKSVSGFSKLITAIEESPIQQVIFTSSTSVYPMNNDWVDESSPTTDSPLARIEKMLIDSLAEKLTLLRLAGLYGYDRQPGRFFRNKKVVSNPNGYINLVHRDDVIAAIAAVIQKQVWGEILNVCSDDHPKRREFYSQQIQAMGLPQPEWQSTVTEQWKKVSNEKIKQVLSVKFRKL